MYIDRIIIFLIGGYAILDALRRRYIPLQREIYLVVVLLIAALVLVRLVRAGTLRPNLAWLAAALVVVFGFSINPYLSTHFELVYFAGDLVILCLLIVMVLGGRVCPEVFTDRTNQVLLITLLGVAMVAAPAVHAVAPVRDQITPPHMVLIAASWAALSCSRGARFRLLIGGLLVLELALAYYSQQRTNVVLWFGFGFLVAVLQMSWRQKLILAVVVCGAVLMAAGPGSRYARSAALAVSAKIVENSRFAELQEGPDESLLGRYLEVQDVALNISHDWTVGNWIFGAGHGATYRPFYWYPERNMKDGRTHNIHFGPALVLYRYGLLGLVGFLLFVAVLAIDFLRNASRPGVGWEDWWSMTVRLGCIGAVLTFLLFNALQDPVVTFIVAAFFYRSGRRAGADQGAGAGFRLAEV